jgi:hypothetical protein
LLPEREGGDLGDRLLVPERLVLDQIAERAAVWCERDGHAHAENRVPVTDLVLPVGKLEQHRLILARPRLDRLLVPHGDLVVPLQQLCYVLPVVVDHGGHLPIARAVTIPKSERIGDVTGGDSRGIP